MTTVLTGSTTNGRWRWRPREKPKFIAGLKHSIGASQETLIFAFAKKCDLSCMTIFRAVRRDLEMNLNKL